MRLFVSIELDVAAKRHLTEVQRIIGPLLSRASLTKPENLHLTLKFLGEVDDRRAEKLTDSLAKVSGPAEIELSAVRIECFPSRGPVRIIAASLDGQLEALGAVHAAIEQRCRFLGFERESREYRPHVTLARGRPTVPPAMRQRLDDTTHFLWPGPVFVAKELVLVRSMLKPQGSEYSTVARFPFGPQG
jgi:2'-5' RNA ligase